MRTEGDVTGGGDFKSSTGRYQEHLLHPKDEGPSDNLGLCHALIWKTFHASSIRCFVGQKAQMMIIIEPQAITLHRHVKDAKTKDFMNVLGHTAQEIFLIAWRYSMPMARPSGWFYAVLITGFIA
jgi:hypothetical protein